MSKHLFIVSTICLTILLPTTYICKDMIIFLNMQQDYFNGGRASIVTNDTEQMSEMTLHKNNMVNNMIKAAKMLENNHIIIAKNEFSSDYVLFKKNAMENSTPAEKEIIDEHMGSPDLNVFLKYNPKSMKSGIDSQNTYELISRRYTYNSESIEDGEIKMELLTDRCIRYTPEELSDDGLGLTDADKNGVESVAGFEEALGNITETFLLGTNPNVPGSSLIRNEFHDIQPGFMTWFGEMNLKDKIEKIYIAGVDIDNMVRNTYKDLKKRLDDKRVFILMDAVVDESLDRMNYYNKLNPNGSSQSDEYEMIIVDYIGNEDASSLSDDSSNNSGHRIII